MLPYNKQVIERDDIAAVAETLQSDWLTTGPKVDEFENAFSLATSSIHAVAVSSGTAALHAAMFAAGIGPGDEVLVPAITFVATANAAVYLGATPVFVDVDPETLLINPDLVREKITPRTRAIVAMDYAGQPCDYPALREIADQHGLTLIADACHSLGGAVHGRRVGSLADMTCFSLHPIKQITAGEGGVVTCNDPEQLTRLREFRNHGIVSDHRQRQRSGTFEYDMTSLGYNYRLTDIQAALALSQLKKLRRFTRRRNDVANFYRSLMESIPFIEPLQCRDDVDHAYHLMVIRWDDVSTGVSRDELYRRLREHGIAANVHYRPVYQHSFYRERLGDQAGICPVAERAYEQILSLPIFVQITEADIRHVVETLESIGAASVAFSRRAA